MPQPYPNPSINESVDLLSYANTVTSGFAVTLFLVASLAIIFLVLKGKFNRISDSSAIAFLLTLVLGSLLWALGLVQGQVLMIFVVGTIGSVLWSVFDSR